MVDRRCGVVQLDALSRNIPAIFNSTDSFIKIMKKQN